MNGNARSPRDRRGRETLRCAGPDLWRTRLPVLSCGLVACGFLESLHERPFARLVVCGSWLSVVPGTYTMPLFTEPVPLFTAPEPMVTGRAPGGCRLPRPVTRPEPPMNAGWWLVACCPWGGRRPLTIDLSPEPLGTECPEGLPIRDPHMVRLMAPSYRAACITTSPSRSVRRISIPAASSCASSSMEGCPNRFGPTLTTAILAPVATSQAGSDVAAP